MSFIVNDAPMYSVDYSRADGFVSVHVRETAVGHTEINALQQCIGNLQVQLMRLIMKDEIDMALHPEKFACDVAPDS